MRFYFFFLLFSLVKISICFPCLAILDSFLIYFIEWFRFLKYLVELTCNKGSKLMSISTFPLFSVSFFLSPSSVPFSHHCF